jgi:tetratricopeptide (TPR) repeat protein
LNKAKELDAKNRYKTDIDLFLQNLYTLYFSSGASNYNDKNYEDAKNNLIAAFKVQEARGVFDTTAAYYAGVTSLMDKDADGTIEYMKKCSEVDYNNPQVYIFWSQAWKIKGDTTQALNVLKDGRTKYPEELSILKEEAQTYLEKGENKKLIESLLKAIEKEPDNANMLFLLAQAYSNEGDDVNAEVYYKKSLEVKPDFFEAYYNIAAIYNNKASALIKEANELPLEESEKYNKLIGEADGFLKQALPWLEKSYELKPDDVYTKHALKEAYTRLKMYEKAKALND